MAAPDSPPQFDLFEARPEPSRHRVGRKPHVPTPEQMLIAHELKAAGRKQAVRSKGNHANLYGRA